MFTNSRPRRLRTALSGAPLLGMLLGPRGVDSYTELLDPMWTSAPRATVVGVRRPTPNSVTVHLAPNVPVAHRAGQHIGVSVEIDGRRHTRYYSPANAEGDSRIELTVARHDMGLVSEYLYRSARPGMVVGLSSPAGDFVLPDRRPRRLLLIAGGSGITPVMSMLRTLGNEGFDGEIALLRYVRTLEDDSYRAEVAAMPNIVVLKSSTRGGEFGADLHGHLTEQHLAAALVDPDAIYVCGPPALVEAVRSLRPDAVAESFVPPALRATPGGGRITFSDSGVDVVDDGQPLLDQAEAAGLRPKSGCRMGICHTCTRRKVHGVVRNIRTGVVSTDGAAAVQICVSVPVGDVDISL